MMPKKFWKISKLKTNDCLQVILALFETVY